MRKLLIAVWLSIGFSYSALAKVDCTPLPYDIKHFNTTEFQACLNLIKLCPKNGLVYDADCLQEISFKHPICSTTQILAQTLKINIDQLSVTPVNQFYILTAYYPADGRHQYYLLTPQICLINTAVDPRDIVNNSYPASDNLLISNTNFPIYKQLKNKQTSFTVTLVIQKDCLACAILAKPQVSFIFDNKGNFLTANLKDSADF